MWIYGGGIMDVETQQDKHLGFSDMDVGQNPVPPVNLKVDGHPKNTTWLVGFDPYPYESVHQ